MLGRHYGLLTPLLDWTKSPYVAAFFAFTGFVEYLSPGSTTTGRIDPQRLLGPDNNKPVAIWSFMVGRATERDEEPEGIDILNSRIDIGHRQRAQRGVFTKLKHEEYFCLEDYLISLQPTQKPLRKYLIPGHEADRVIMDLRMMNITFATLFPDLDGAALQANFEMAFYALRAFSMLPSGAWMGFDPSLRTQRGESA